MEEEYFTAIGVLQKIGVNFVGIDFDQTFVAKHTNGRWQGSPEDLASHARGEFVLLVKYLLNHGFFVAIVTFSGQRNLIEAVLRIVFGNEIADKIVIRAKDNSWGGGGEGAKEGKQKYLASAAEQFQRLHGVEITRNTTLLIDDDHRNIQIALDKGVRALLFLPEEPESLMSQIISLPV